MCQLAAYFSIGCALCVLALISSATGNSAYNRNQFKPDAEHPFTVHNSIRKRNYRKPEIRSIPRNTIRSRMTNIHAKKSKKRFHSKDSMTGTRKNIVRKISRTLMLPLNKGESLSKNHEQERNEQCVFPFIYDGLTHFTCIEKGKKKPWCSLTSNHDRDAKWTYCSSPSSVENVNAHKVLLVTNPPGTKIGLEKASNKQASRTSVSRKHVVSKTNAISAKRKNDGRGLSPGAYSRITDEKEQELTEPHTSLALKSSNEVTKKSKDAMRYSSLMLPNLVRMPLQNSSFSIREEAERNDDSSGDEENTLKANADLEERVGAAPSGKSKKYIESKTFKNHTNFRSSIEHDRRLKPPVDKLLPIYSDIVDDDITSIHEDDAVKKSTRNNPDKSDPSSYSDNTKAKNRMIIQRTDLKNNGKSRENVTITDDGDAIGRKDLVTTESQLDVIDKMMKLVNESSDNDEKSFRQVFNEGDRTKMKEEETRKGYEENETKREGKNVKTEDSGIISNRVPTNPGKNLTEEEETITSGNVKETNIPQQETVEKNPTDKETEKTSVKVKITSYDGKNPRSENIAKLHIAENTTTGNEGKSINLERISKSSSQENSVKVPKQENTIKTSTEDKIGIQESILQNTNEDKDKEKTSKAYTTKLPEEGTIKNLLNQTNVKPMSETDKPGYPIKNSQHEDVIKNTDHQLETKGEAQGAMKKLSQEGNTTKSLDNEDVTNTGVKVSSTEIPNHVAQVKNPVKNNITSFEEQGDDISQLEEGKIAEDPKEERITKIREQAHSIDIVNPSNFLQNSGEITSKNSENISKSQVGQDIVDILERGDKATNKEKESLQNHIYNKAFMNSTMHKNQNEGGNDSEEVLDDDDKKLISYVSNKILKHLNNGSKDHLDEEHGMKKLRQDASISKLDEGGQQFHIYKVKEENENKFKDSRNDYGESNPPERIPTSKKINIIIINNRRNNSLDFNDIDSNFAEPTEGNTYDSNTNSNIEDENTPSIISVDNGPSLYAKENSLSLGKSDIQMKKKQDNKIDRTNKVINKVNSVSNRKPKNNEEPKKSYKQVANENKGKYNSTKTNVNNSQADNNSQVKNETTPILVKSGKMDMANQESKSERMNKTVKIIPQHNNTSVENEKTSTLTTSDKENKISQEDKNSSSDSIIQKLNETKNDTPTKNKMATPLSKSYSQTAVKQDNKINNTNFHNFEIASMEDTPSIPPGMEINLSKIEKETTANKNNNSTKNHISDDAKPIKDEMESKNQKSVKPTTGDEDDKSNITKSIMSKMMQTTDKILYDYSNNDIVGINASSNNTAPQQLTLLTNDVFKSAFSGEVNDLGDNRYNYTAIGDALNNVVNLIEGNSTEGSKEVKKDDESFTSNGTHIIDSFGEPQLIDFNHRTKESEHSGDEPNNSSRLASWSSFKTLINEGGNNTNRTADSSDAWIQSARDFSESLAKGNLSKKDIELKFEEGKQYLQTLRVKDLDESKANLVNSLSKNQNNSQLRNEEKPEDRELVDGMPLQQSFQQTVRMNYVPEGSEIETFGGNGNKAKCVFPFIFDGDSYFNCITKTRTKPWCSVTQNYDRMPIWGYCSAANPPKNKEIAEEKFMNGTKNAENGKKKSEFAELMHDDGEEVISATSGMKTFGGNSRGARCVIPFVYDGQSYMKCIPRPDGNSWCATTHNYDNLPKWGICCDQDIYNC